MTSELTDIKDSKKEPDSNNNSLPHPNNYKSWFEYLEKIDLMNTYNLNTTLWRGRKDRVNWGYDS